MTTAIRPLPPRSRPGLGVSAPSPAMMRRRINPQLVPLRDGDITTTPRPTTAAGAEAVLATIHVDAAVTTTAAIACGELRVSFPGLDDAVSREPERKIIIHSDSRYALGALSGKWVPQWATGKLLSQLNRARATIREHGIRLRWVRGHSGDTLKEIAERLAVHRRRCTECDIDEEVILEREGRIVEDYFAGDQFSAMDLAA